MTSFPSADHSHLGLLQGYNYRPDDVYLGQLGGCLEAIDAGTTFVLDHSHATYSQDHGKMKFRLLYSAAYPAKHDYTSISSIEGNDDLGHPIRVCIRYTNASYQVG